MANKLSPAYFQAITRYRYGLRSTRPDGPRLGPVNGPYSYVYARWAAFDRWSAWRDRGGPRPPGVWQRVPSWDGTYTPWNLRVEILKLRPHPPPPPDKHPPIHPYSLAPAQSWLILAGDNEDSLEAPPYYGRAYTADAAYKRPTAALVAHYKASGVRQAVWCDCDATPAQAAKDLATELGLPLWIGQGETAGQALRALDAGAPIIVGHLDGVREESATAYAIVSAAILAGVTLWIDELYANCGTPDLKPDWHGLPVAGSCIAIYSGDGGKCPGLPFETYYASGRYVPHRDSVYGVGFTPDMYRHLP